MKAEEKPLIVALTNVKIDIGKKATDHGEKYGNGTDANGRFSKTRCILIHDFVSPFRLFDKRTDDDAEHNGNGNTKTVFLEPRHLFAELDAKNHNNADGTDEAGQGRSDGGNHTALEALGAISLRKTDKRSIFVAKLSKCNRLDNDDGNTGTCAQPHGPVFSLLITKCFLYSVQCFRCSLYRKQIKI